MENKEIIDRLHQYFIGQDHSVVCRCLANMMIDLNRIYNFEHLDEEEASNLESRIEKNCLELMYFIDNYPNSSCGKLNILHVN